MNPIDLHEKQYLLYGGYQFNQDLLSYIKATLATRDDLISDGLNVSNQVIEFYMDMLIVEVISRFFFMYSNSWDVHIQSFRRGGSTGTSIFKNKPYPPVNPIKWSDWLASLDRNSTLYVLLKEYSDDYWRQKMVVPPKTNVRLYSERSVRKIFFKNKFAEICITFRRRHGSRDLGDYQLLLGYDYKKNDSYWSEHFEVTCNADFEKLRSGHPEMGRYMSWVKTMFSELEYRLDNRQRMKRALEYKNLLNLTQ